MENNTDKTTIDISNESLENAAYNASLKYEKDNAGECRVISNADYCAGAEFGANWQKEKGKANYDKLVEALRELYNAFYNDTTIDLTGHRKACKNAKQLLKSIEQDI